MPSFATLEQRVTRAAVRRTANATGEWLAGGGAAAVPGIRLVLDRETLPGMGGMVSAREPVASVCAADMPAAARGQRLNVVPDTTDGTPQPAQAYQIRNALPDGTGLLVLELVAEGSL